MSKKNVIEITDEKDLPKFMADKLAEERKMFPNSKLPQTLGSTGYQVYQLGDPAEFWVWDNGTGGRIIYTLDDKRSMNMDDLGKDPTPQELDRVEQARAKQLLGLT